MKLLPLLAFAWILGATFSSVAARAASPQSPTARFLFCATQLATSAGEISIDQWFDAYVEILDQANPPEEILAKLRLRPLEALPAPLLKDSALALLNEALTKYAEFAKTTLSADERRTLRGRLSTEIKERSQKRQAQSRNARTARAAVRQVGPIALKPKKLNKPMSHPVGEAFGAASSSGRFVLLFGDDGEMRTAQGEQFPYAPPRLLDLETRRETPLTLPMTQEGGIFVFWNHTKFAISEEARRVAINIKYPDSSIAIWELGRSKVLEIIPLPGSSSDSVAEVWFSPNGRFLRAKWSEWVQGGGVRGGMVHHRQELDLDLPERIWVEKESFPPTPTQLLPSVVKDGLEYRSSAEFEPYRLFAIDSTTSTILEGDYCMGACLSGAPATRPAYVTYLDRFLFSYWDARAQSIRIELQMPRAGGMERNEVAELPIRLSGAATPLWKFEELPGTKDLLLLVEAGSETFSFVAHAGDGFRLTPLPRFQFYSERSIVSEQVQEPILVLQSEFTTYRGRWLLATLGQSVQVWSLRTGRKVAAASQVLSQHHYRPHLTPGPKGIVSIDGWGESHWIPLDFDELARAEDADLSLP